MFDRNGYLKETVDDMISIDSRGLRFRVASGRRPFFFLSGNRFPFISFQVAPKIVGSVSELS